MHNAAGILFRSPEGRVLLLRRTDGTWDYPGGGAMEGETADKTAIREALEETKYFAGHAGRFHTRRVRDEVDYTTFLYDCDAEFIPRLSSEHTDYIWIDPKRVLSRARADAWSEGQHPRGPDGKFISGIGSGAKPASVEMNFAGGTQAGYTEGGIGTDKSGQEHYVKFPPKEDHAKVEALSGDLMDAAGVETVHPKFQITNGKASVSSELNPALHQLKLADLTNPGSLPKPQQADLAGMYAMAVLTNNWDAVGGEGGMPINIMLDESTGKLVQLDLGGSFQFSGTGAPKPFPADPIDTASNMMNPKYSSGKVFGALFEQDPGLWASAFNTLYNMDMENVGWMFQHSGMPNKEVLFKTFAERRKAMLSWLSDKVSTSVTPKPAASKPAAPVMSMAPMAPEFQQAMKAYAHHLMHGFKGLEKGSPEYAATQKELAKLKSEMNELAPAGYFEQKAAATKAKKAAAQAKKAAQVAPEPVAAPPVTPATAPEPAAPAVVNKPTPVVKSAAKMMLQTNLSDLDTLLESEGVFEFSNNPAAYQKKLETAVASYKAAIANVQDLAAIYKNVDLPTVAESELIGKATNYLAKFGDFLAAKQKIVEAKKTQVGVSVAKMEAQNAKANLQEAQSQLSATKELAPAAPPKPANTKLVYGKSAEGGVYPGYTRHESHSQHKLLGKAMKQVGLNPSQKKSLASYKGSGYIDLNESLRSPKGLTPEIVKDARNMTAATLKGKVPKGTVLYRGVKDSKDLWPGTTPETFAKLEKGHLDNGFISTSTSLKFASGWSGSDVDAVVMEYLITGDNITGCHVAEGKNEPEDSEQEIVLPRGTIWQAVGYREEKVDGVYKKIVTMESV